MKNKQNSSKQFDVIILGSGIAGSTLGTILAKHQARVLIIDKATHPRFAIGEAITSHTEKLFATLSHQYSIPEFKYLSSFHNITKNFKNSGCGYKRCFGFLYHQADTEQSPEDRILWGTSHSSHLFRQEIDLYLVETATKYGAKLLTETNVTNVNISKDIVEVQVNNCELFTANYLIDASGYNSLLAKKYDLREKSTRFKTQSRSIFTHMVGVKRADDCLKSNSEHSISWSQGTVHHIFDGGWMWVIPFNNHENANNPICSVGLNLDLRSFPRDENLTPQEEFQSFLSRFPTIAAQFENAQPIREWTSTGRLQYSSSSCVGERFYILPHAAGFVDPIFSTGLTQTFICVSSLAALLLKAITDNDFSIENFAPLEELQQNIFDYNDKIANCTYISFRDFDLLNAWLRVWLLQHMMSVAKLACARLFGLSLETYKQKKIEDWSRFTTLDYLQDIDPRTERWGKNYVQRAVLEMEKVEKGLIQPKEAAANIVSLLNSTSWLFQTCGLGNPSERFMDILISKRFSLSFIAYSFWSHFFLRKELRPYNFQMKEFIEITRLGIEV